MITRTKQDWTPGAVVRVGFMRLRVLGAKAVKDGLPDLYFLESLKGGNFYRFVPHNGIEKILESEVLR